MATASRQHRPSPRPSPGPAGTPGEGVAAQFAEGLRRHEAGDMDGAARHCEAVLAQQPDYGEALVLLGRIAHQTNRHAEAIEHLRAALRHGDLDDDGLRTLGEALEANGELEPSQRCFALLAGRSPRDPRPHAALGTIAWNEGNLATAAAHLWLARCRGGESVELLSNLGDALLLLGRIHAAREALARAVALAPRSEELRLHLASIDAPDDPIAVKRELGLTLLSAGFADEAEILLKEALAEAPEDREASRALGDLYRDTERADDAIAVCRRAVARFPNDPKLQAGLGAALAMTGAFADADACLAEATRLDPGFAEAHKHQAKILLEQCRPKEALAACERALEAAPGDPDAMFAHAVVLLLHRRYEAGWAGYEARRNRPGKPFPAPALAEWQGEPLAGQSLHIVTEQGAGDTVMFATCIGNLDALGGPVSLHCEPRLVPVMARSFPRLTVVPTLPEPSENALWTPLGSLPRLTRASDADFAGGAPYMLPDPAAAARWRAWYATLGDGPKIGIAWRGGKGAVEGRKRTIALTDWMPLLSLQDCVFVDLQYGAHDAERAAVRDQLGPTLHRPEGPDPVNDLDDFTARVSALDLVISVDNTTVHFAGALGVPVWTLVPAAPSWRWQLDRLDSPWYPSMRLVRQGPGASWASVLDRIAFDLKVFRAGQEPHAPAEEKDRSARITISQKDGTAQQTGLDTPPEETGHSAQPRPARSRSETPK